LPIKEMKVVFKSGEPTARVEIDMPDCEVEKDVDEEQIDTVSFALVLTETLDSGANFVSKKKFSCFINIEAINQDEQEREALERRKMLDFFMSENNVSWGQQFKIACILGPSIN